MPAYAQGILIAFVEPLFHAGCNVVDRFLSDKVFPRLTTLVFFGTLTTLVLTSITVFIFDRPHLLAPHLLLFVFLIACIEVAWLFPYYWSLGEIDTSVVASLFSLGKIVLPLLAFFFLGERLHALQYVGFFIIIGASAALSFDRQKLRLNRAFYLMLGVSLALAVEAILYKYTFTHGAGWGSLIFTVAVFEVVIMSVLMLGAGALPSLGSDIKKAYDVGPLFAVNEFFGWAGNAGNSLALALLPVTISQAITSTQPIFVLFYAYLFKHKRPEFFREQIGAADIKKKILLFVFTTAGILLVVAFGSVDI